MLDDPGLSERARRFLARHAIRRPHLDAAAVRAAAVLPDGAPAPVELADVLVWFEERYGGLSYPLLVGNGMEHGVRRGRRFVVTALGLAFGGIVDGDWTCGVGVLLDGSTTMDLGEWGCRVIDRSVDQRIEKHALLAEVRDWRHHQTFACRTPPDVPPMVDERWLPPPVPEATGPAELWWSDGDAAVQATLWSWRPEGDRWIVRYFARVWEKVDDASRTVYAAMGHETVPAEWCYLCDTSVAAGYRCIR
ncbi:hypothetical protein ACFPIJ_31665 [Dactylosporangium cerinum]|uniref:Uncharacterized protein n=1 Tax=Dactylosporangium cerinum TaxID=1434730 RepID=A0ABV9W339_9ACTN